MKGTAYLIQATIIILWWLGLLLSQDFYEAFQFPHIGRIAFNSFLAPDIVVVALLSIVRAYKPLRELELIILGGFAFGALYCLNATILTGGGYLSTILMFLGLFYNIFIVYQNVFFRESDSDNKTINGYKTIVQIICIWAITLFFFPMLILKAFNISLNPPLINLVIGTVLFILFSSLGILSAFVMVRDGNGTPLPLDQTQRLVSKGPYKYVRNPMAIAGIGQALSISLIFSSFHICIYALIGAILWQVVVRPAEEANMSERFGEDYEEYRKRVSCWLPKL